MHDQAPPSDTRNAVSAAIRQHTLGDFLRRTAQRVPGKTAIICGDVRWSYAEFDRIVNRLARGLVAEGIAAGERVAILSRNSHAFAALRFALAKIGAVLVPINFMLNAEECAFILKSAGAKALALGPDFVELGRAAAAKDTVVERLWWIPGEAPSAAPADLKTFDALLANDDSAPSADLDARMLAQIVYTSGTESLPKGAMLTHEAVAWEYVSCVIEGEMSGDDVMLHALPLYPARSSTCSWGPASISAAPTSSPASPSPR